MPAKSEYGEDYSHLLEQRENFKGRGHRVNTAIRTFRECVMPLRLRPGGKVLDIGAGIGYTGHYLKYGGINTVSLDFNLYAHKAGEELFGLEKRNQRAVGNGESLPFDSDSFDGIVTQDFLEHLESSEVAERVFAEMERVSKGKRMVHKITVLEDVHWIHGDETHHIKQNADWWEKWFSRQGWRTVSNPTHNILDVRGRRLGSFPMHGYFVIEKMPTK